MAGERQPLESKLELVNSVGDRLSLPGLEEHKQLPIKATAEKWEWLIPGTLVGRIVSAPVYIDAADRGFHLQLSELPETKSTLIPLKGSFIGTKTPTLQRGQQEGTLVIHNDRVVQLRNIEEIKKVAAELNVKRSWYRFPEAQAEIYSVLIFPDWIAALSHYRDSKDVGHCVLTWAAPGQSQREIVLPPELMGKNGHDLHAIAVGKNYLLFENGVICQLNSKDGTLRQVASIDHTFKLGRVIADKNGYILSSYNIETKTLTWDLFLVRESKERTEVVKYSNCNSFFNSLGYSAVDHNKHLESKFSFLQTLQPDLFLCNASFGGHNRIAIFQPGKNLTVFNINCNKSVNVIIQPDNTLGVINGGYIYRYPIPLTFQQEYAFHLEVEKVLTEQGQPRPLARIVREYVDEGFGMFAPNTAENHKRAIYDGLRDIAFEIKNKAADKKTDQDQSDILAITTFVDSVVKGDAPADSLNNIVKELKMSAEVHGQLSDAVNKLMPVRPELTGLKPLKKSSRSAGPGPGAGPGA